MRFLVDESVGVDIVRYLRRTGHDVVYIAEVAAGTFDEDVLKRAAEGKPHSELPMTKTSVT